MEEIATFDAKIKIEKLYNIIYPYGKFKGDYSHACIAIKKEITELCKDKRKDLLIVINKSLDLDITEGDSIKKLCDNIINNVINLCIQNPVSKIDMILYLKYGIVPSENEDSLNLPPSEDIRHPQGFLTPILVNDNMKNFIKNGNFGPSDPSNPNSTPLNYFISARYNGILNHSIMTLLFIIYAKVNKMQKDPANKQYLTSTQEMNQYFQETYTRLAQKDPKYQRDIPTFDPNRFRYASFQSIISDNIIKKNDMTKEQKNALCLFDEDDEISQEKRVECNRIIPRLKLERNFLSDVLSVYKTK